MANYNALLSVAPMNPGAAYINGVGARQEQMANQQKMNFLAQDQERQNMLFNQAQEQLKSQQLQAEKIKQHDLEVAGAKQIIYSRDAKATAELLHPEYVNQLKQQGIWDTVTDQQVRDHQREVVMYADSKAGIAPKQQEYRVVKPGEEHIPVDDMGMPMQNGILRGEKVLHPTADGLLFDGKNYLDPDGNVLTSKQVLEWKARLSGDRSAATFAATGGQGRMDRQNDRTAIKDAQSMRKEFDSLPSVKQYKIVLPLYHRAKSAPDTRAGDISVIYALGKMFDPTSVVREGELKLSASAAPWVQQMASAINSQITGKGRINPETRAQIMDALNGQVEADKMAYGQDYDRFSQYAESAGYKPFDVVGDRAENAFDPQPTSSSKNFPPPMNSKGWALHQDAKGNKAYVSPDGKQYEELK